MKDYWVLFSFIFAGVIANAQIQLGVKVGGNFNLVTTDVIDAANVCFLYDPEIPQTTFGYQFSIIANKNISDKISLGVEPGYVFNKTGNIELISSENMDLKIHAVTLPFLINWNVGRTIYLFAGPEVSYIFQHNLSLPVNKSNMAGKIGIGAKINKIGGSISYLHSFTPFVEVDSYDLEIEPDWLRNNYFRTFSLGVSYYLN